MRVINFLLLIVFLFFFMPISSWAAAEELNRIFDDPYNGNKRTEIKQCLKITNLSREVRVNLTNDTMKKILLKQAKRAALIDLLHEQIPINLANNALDIVQIATDADAAPQFSNGMALGEVCVLINAYLPANDVVRFHPHKISLSDFCLAEDIPFSQLKTKTHAAAFLELIHKYDANAIDITLNEAKLLAHDVIIINEAMNPVTGAFCLGISANIIPIEVDIFNNKSVLPTQSLPLLAINKQEDIWQYIELDGMFEKGNFLTTSPQSGKGEVHYSFALEKKSNVSGDISLEVYFPSKDETCFRLDGFWFADVGANTLPPQNIEVHKDFGTGSWRFEEPKCMIIGHYYIMESKDNWVLAQVMDFYTHVEINDDKPIPDNKDQQVEQQDDTPEKEGGFFSNFSIPVPDINVFSDHDNDDMHHVVMSLRYLGPAQSLQSMNDKLRSISDNLE
ncbi:MAG: hypothetical protein R8L53_09380 [Mariprofundales bacterium]